MKTAKKDIGKVLQTNTPSITILTKIATYNVRLERELEQLTKLFTDQYTVDC